MGSSVPHRVPMLLTLLSFACSTSSPRDQTNPAPSSAGDTASGPSGDSALGGDTAPSPGDTGDTGDPPAPPVEKGPLFGAIRWDAWQEEEDVNAVVESTLGPARWHDRLPFFSEELAADAVRIRGNSDAVMAEELRYAERAGIDYWAFVAYPPDIGMSNALQRYRAAADKRGIDFALVLQGGWLASTADTDWEGQVARYVEMFGDPAYTTVAGGRPLLFLFDASSMLGSTRFPDTAAARSAFDALRAASVGAGRGDPYLVLMGWSPATDAVTAAALGMDALSAYAVVPTAMGASPFSTAATQATALWSAQAETGLGVVPVVSAGWDPRPRIETPTPWATYSKAWFEPPATDELRDHLRSALRWVEDHPTAAEAAAVVAYAWNEHDEGGWLCPTWTGKAPNTERIDAVAEAILAHEAALPLRNGSFEAPQVGYGWYVVPHAGLPADLAWSAGASPGAYLLADTIAAHFGAAAEGQQALLLSSAGWIAQDVPVDGARTVQLSYQILTGTYPGDTEGTLRVSLAVDGVTQVEDTVITPATPGVWEAHTLTGEIPGPGTLTIRLESVSGMPWLDAVTLE